MLRNSLLAVIFIGGPAFADPQADADYIVSQIVTQTLFEGAIKAQAPMITSAVQNDLRAIGIELPDPDRFMELFIAEFIGEFTTSMQAQTGEIYLDKFSADELHEIASFYRTPAGQAMIDATPDLMLAGAQLGAKAGQQAGRNAGRRLADTIEAEGLMLVEDPSLMQKLLDALR